MDTDSRLNDLADELVALFNRRSMDLPDGLFDRHTQLLLNGTPFEEMLGRSPTDPLVLMIARGAAGYRFAMKAIQHAVPDAHVARGALEPVLESPGAIVLPLWLSGHLRGSGQPLEAVMRATVLLTAGGTVAHADLVLDAEHLARITEARTS